jgi:membrane-associated phospholipid phosphatase
MLFRKNKNKEQMKSEEQAQTDEQEAKAPDTGTGDKTRPGSFHEGVGRGTEQILNRLPGVDRQTAREFAKNAAEVAKAWENFVETGDTPPAEPLKDTYRREFKWLNGIQNVFANRVMDTVMRIFSHLGDVGAIWIVTGIVLILIPAFRKTGAVVLVALVLSAIICNGIIKNIVGRARPYSYEQLELLIRPPKDPSFPSGHTSASVAAVTAMALTGFSWWPLFAVIAFLIAFSRMYLYVHFPSDILGGAAFGLLIGWLAVKMMPYITILR